MVSNKKLLTPRDCELMEILIHNAQLYNFYCSVWARTS